jgi:hypothetical protein
MKATSTEKSIVDAFGIKEGHSFLSKSDSDWNGMDFAHTTTTSGEPSSWYVKNGLVVKVGERKSADPRSHARKQPLFVLAGGAV